ncbi:unnamed protein product [Urochloa humidicola]
MVFTEGSRVFIRNDSSVNQWLLGSTSAFRWEDVSSPRNLLPPTPGKIIAVVIAVGIAVTPLEFRHVIVEGILKVALLVTISLLLTRVRRGWFAGTVLCLLLTLAVIGTLYAYVKVAIIDNIKRNGWGFHRKAILRGLRLSGLIAAWIIGTYLAALLGIFIREMAQSLKKPLLVIFQVVIGSGLACLPLLHAILPSYYRYLSISASIVLLILSKRDNLQLRSYSSCGLLLQILETTLPILFFWSLMFPVPGISLKISYYMLFSVVAAVLIANLQIPVAFLLVLLSAMRLRVLLGHHHHDYRPLPPDASPNLVPSIVIFFMMALCQGTSYILATFLGIISLFYRRSLARDLKFELEWGTKALNLYERQVYQERTEKGLLPSEKSTPGLESFAIKSIGSTSREMQIAGLRVLDSSLKRWDSEYKKKLVQDIVKDAQKIVTDIIGLISYLIDEENRAREKEKTQQEEEVEEKTEQEEEEEEKTEPEAELSVSLKLVGNLAINGGKLSTIFRQELSKNPFFLYCLERVLELEGSEPKLWEPVMNIIAVLALDKASREEIGSTQCIIPKLMHAFLMPDDAKPGENNAPSLRMAAVEALANLTIMSTDNCWAVLLADPKHNLIKNLINMLEDKHAANLLHNLCVNLGDKLIEHGSSDEDMKSALVKVIEIIQTNMEGEKLEAALCIASKIGCVIPQHFVQLLESDTNAAAAEALVENLVNTLKSNREPSLERPRIRRVLIEVIMSIVNLCHTYRKIFREKGAKDALDMIKGTPSRLEKYSVFLRGEGVVVESLPMSDLVDEAKRLIDPETPTPGAQPVDHA